MVILNKIYTRTGDAGETGIGSGARVSKLDLRIVAGGSVDETNSCIGVAAAHCEVASMKSLLFMLQQRLFDLGADLTTPWAPEPAQGRCPRMTPQHVEWLEQQIDSVNNAMSPLKSFVLPGGTLCAASLHLARSVCRRAELDTLRLQVETPLNPQVAVFLNRLSDLLFVLARDANDHGQTDVLWEPGRV
jgi:cob(I)alamin adenosyltransferase